MVRASARRGGSEGTEGERESLSEHESPPRTRAAYGLKHQLTGCARVAHFIGPFQQRTESCRVQ